MIKTKFIENSPPNLRITQVATNFIIHSKPLTCGCFCRAGQKFGNLRGKKTQSSGHRRGGFATAREDYATSMEGSEPRTVLFVLQGQLVIPAAKARVPMSRFWPASHFLTSVKAPPPFVKWNCRTRYRQNVCYARK
jgi:hypothetical protein